MRRWVNSSALLNWFTRLLNELFDFGRPAQVELMVLVDRESRELPISADFVGELVCVPENQVLVLEKDDAGKFSFQLEGRAA